MKYLLNKKDKNKIKYEKNKKLLNYLSLELNNSKSRIDDKFKEWDIVKKHIHDHEYVFYSSYRKKNISKVTPVSRSYFKLREIFYEYNINILKDSKICCLAEAPGGFIQSIFHLNHLNHNIKMYINTLLNSDKNIPLWNNIIKRYNLNYLYGKKGNGDLYDYLNCLSMINKIGKNYTYLVTGDGGFDYSSDYSKQEENSLRLIYSEIFIALNIQKKGGIFICKIFDTFLEKTINLLSLLNISYEKVYIHKPKISRNSNSEKYIVCIGYKGYNKLIINKMSHGFRDSNIGIVSIDSYYDCIIHYIIKYTINQIKSINKGIDLIINKNITKNPTLFQINEAIDWCNKYKIPINKHCMYLK